MINHFTIEEIMKFIIIIKYFNNSSCNSKKTDNAEKIIDMIDGHIIFNIILKNQFIYRIIIITLFNES